MFKATFRFPTGYSETMSAKAKAAAQMAVRRGVDLALNGLRAASHRGPLFARTGNLARSWQQTATKITPDGVSAGIVSSAPYWRIHEYGGKIVPVKAKALTIPILDNLTGKAKVARYASVAMLKAEFGAKKVFVFKSHAGNKIIGVRDTKKGLKAFFVLKQEVTIKATHYIRNVAQDVQPKVKKYLLRELISAFKN
jgi:hypothetical protein